MNAQPNEMDSICNDLEAETADLVSVLQSMSPTHWDAQTPSPGWSVRDQISHLTYFDYTGLLAATDPEGFRAAAEALMGSGVGTDAGLAEGRALPPNEVLNQFISARTTMVAAFRTLDSKARLPWYGPAMGALSFATARLMETWAHGQDICDTVGIQRTPTARLRHVAHIGVRARRFAYAINRKTLPDGPDGAVAVILASPDGDTWEWDQAAAEHDSIRGSALDFCLLVTQRRNIVDTSLVVAGPHANEWVPIAQAFAGDPGGGRQPGQFA